MVSFAQGLAKVRKKPPFSIQAGFQTNPGSVKEILRIMNLKKPNVHTLQHHRIHEFSVNDAQGLAYADGATWFLSSQWELFEFDFDGSDLFRPNAIYRRKSLHLHDLIQSIGLNAKDYDHIGDVHWFEGMLFVPIRHVRHAPPHLLLGLDRSLQTVAYCWISESSDSWCVVNPWNRALYMPDGNQADLFNAYDVSSFLRVLPRRSEWGRQRPIRRLPDANFRLFKEDGSPDLSGGFQGAYFSNNGRFYLTRAEGYSTGWHNYIHVYETLTGIRLGVSREYDFPATWDEIEGISIHPSGVIYIAVADNDWPSKDEFWTYAFKYSDSTPI